MIANLTRRQLIGSVAAAGLAQTAPGWIGAARAEAPTLSAVEWGGDVVEAMKQIAAGQHDVSVKWGLHQGGAAAILPKIKATWPTVDYDYIAGWEGSFNTMVKEDWLETISPADVPNLADIPEKIIIRDAKGAIKAVPRAVGGMYFGYRTDTAPVKVAKIDDLFDPKLKGAVCWPGPRPRRRLSTTRPSSSRSRR